MDSITHAASGAVAMLAMSRRPESLWAVPLAALAAASPDLDIVFAHTPLQFLLLHRGVSHALAFAPLLGLILVLPAWPLWRPHTPGRWSFGKVWLFMVGMLLLHIWLDCITTYGTLVFLPFSDLRVRLNAVFIIDFLLTLPLLWAIWRWRARRGLMQLALAWIFVYPGLAMALNARITSLTTTRLEARGSRPDQIVVLPDAFAPFFWRVLHTEQGPQGAEVHSQGLDALGRPHSPASVHTALPSSLREALARQSVTAGAFFQFTLLPVMKPLPPNELPQGGPPKDSPAPDAAAPGATYPRRFMVCDLRFGSSLDLVRNIMAMRSQGETPFSYMAELGPAADGTRDRTEKTRLVRERLRFAGRERQAPWQAPRPPAPPPWRLWLVGLR